MRTNVIAVCLAGLVACAPSEAEIEEGGEAMTAAARTVGEYQADMQVRARDGQPLDIARVIRTYGLDADATRWTCRASANARLRETARDPAGKPTVLASDGSREAIDVANPNTQMTLTRDFLRTDPVIEARMMIECFGSPIGRKERRHIRVLWTCDQRNFPDKVGEVLTKTCTGKADGLTERDAEAELNAATLVLRTKLVAKRDVVDIDACPKDARGMDRFGLRITQGLTSGHLEQGRKLKITLDGQALPPIASKTGLFSHAIAFCRPHAPKPLLRVALSGIEEDLVFDDVYTAVPEDRNVLMKPGTRREFRLLRGDAESNVIVELFGDEPITESR
jgi:hypothetical protein